MEKFDKRDRSAIFRTRLAEAMRRAGFSQTALARATGVDRSTVSQLLGGDAPRLPGAQLVAEAATALGVSTDWLLALSDRPESAAEVLAASLTVTRAPRALVDQQILDWYREAKGYKIRNVPAALPDLLKTEDVMRWEYAAHLGRSSEQAIGAAQDRLAWVRDSSSEFEIAMPLYEVDSLARGEGYYRGLSRNVRLAQIDRMFGLADALYPRLRLFLFDARRIFSAPVTVFGPLLAAIYIGQNYLVFRDSDKISLLSWHVDNLVREASVGDRDFAGYLRRLRSEL